MHDDLLNCGEHDGWLNQLSNIPNENIGIDHLKLRLFSPSNHQTVLINKFKRTSIKAWMIDEKQWFNSSPLIVSKLNAQLIMRIWLTFFYISMEMLTKFTSFKWCKTTFNLNNVMNDLLINFIWKNTQVTCNMQPSLWCTSNECRAFNN